MPNLNKDSIKVLFVCLGNICRSPSAQAVFEAYIKKAKLAHLIKVDSCGTAAYHINEPPDSRSIAAAEERGYAISHLRGRQLSLKDFDNFDYILAMDSENLTNIKRLISRDLHCSHLNGEVNTHVSLFLDFMSKPEKNKSVSRFVSEVPDPYYGGDQGFSDVLDLIESASEGLINHIINTHLKEN